MFDTIFWKVRIWPNQRILISYRVFMSFWLQINSPAVIKIVKLCIETHESFFKCGKFQKKTQWLIKQTFNEQMNFKYFEVKFLLWKGHERRNSRGLASPYRYHITSFSQLKRISQSGQDTFFILSFLTFKAFVMFVTFLQFKSNLYVVLACGKGFKNSIHWDLFKTKNILKKKQAPAEFYAPYGAWTDLQPNWFSKMPQKRQLLKISS